MPTWLTKRLCWPIWQLWPTCTRLSILVPVADAGGLEGAAVDGGAGADLDVVADLDVAQLRHLDVPAVLQPIAETVRSQDRVGMNDDAVAQHGAVVEDGVGKNGHVVAEPAVPADHRPRVDFASHPTTVPSPRAASGKTLGSAPMRTVGSIAASGSMPCGSGSLRPCRWRTMAIKAPSGSATRITLCPLVGNWRGTTTAEARLSARR